MSWKFYIILFIIGLLLFFYLIYRLKKASGNTTEPEFIGLRPLFTNEPIPYDPLSPNYFYEQLLKLHRFNPNNYISYHEDNQIEYIEQDDEVYRYDNVPKFRNKGDIKPQQNRRWKRQAKCCEILERVYNKQFVSVRPGWLKNPETGGNLELDCYNDELKIALEYNGIQHYVFPNPFHKTYDDFIALIRRDKFKLEQCDKNDIYLITVPYNIKEEDIEDYIIQRLPENIDNDITYTSDTVYSNSPNNVTIVEYSV